MEFQPSAPPGSVFCACVCVMYSLSVSKQTKTLKPDNENWSCKETSCRRALFGQLLPSFLGPSAPCFRSQILLWLKAAAHVEWMCLSVLQMLVCVLCCWWWKEVGVDGVHKSRLLHLLSDVLHVSQAMCQGQLWLCEENVCVSVFPFQTSPLFSLAAFCPKFQFGCPWEGIQIMRNTIRVCCSASLE